ncbi:hypothetical protein C1H46_031855 [Malus baccata]|uniref:Phosphofructokinase domain-containing protein n=1 Tax=Malus baccata TaxID=106549 RepID=A0A540L8J0_MALBA|nr:hypothetical protein C1H46_031855 [Malus baccata]
MGDSNPAGNVQMKVVKGDFGYVLEDVPHLSDYLSDLPTYPNPLRFNPAYSVVKQYFVNVDDTVAQKIVVHTDSPRGTHFRRAGPRQKVYFNPAEVHACIVTCGGLCPGLNTVIREIVCGLYHMYGVSKVLGIDGGYKGFYARNTVTLTPKVVNDIHKRGGTIIGFIAMYATLASRDVDCCLIPESPFYLEGKGGLFEYIEKRLKENGHMVIVIAEGAGQDLLSESLQSMNQQDASGNKQLKDVGLWISERIKSHFGRQQKLAINLKYIDPTYMIRAIPSNAADNVYCTLLAQSAVHGAMAGYTGFICGPVNGRHSYIPFNHITEKQNKVVITDRMWARLLSSTNQPSFLNPKDVTEIQEDEDPPTQMLDGENCKDSKFATKDIPSMS